MTQRRLQVIGILGENAAFMQSPAANICLCFERVSVLGHSGSCDPSSIRYGHGVILTELGHSGSCDQQHTVRAWGRSY